MHISFDLDGTLIPFSNEFQVQGIPPWSRLLGAEAMRSGARELLGSLISEGHQISVYTTSYRSPWCIRLSFWLLGIRLNQVITQPTHLKVMAEKAVYASKYPPAFGIDLHIDDAAGVRIEGEQLGFQTLILKPDDHEWIETVRHWFV